MNTEVERKKEKKLDRNHWMCRIQKYTFGIDAPSYYIGYCPFFWMTWLALLCCPFVWLFTKLTFPIVTGWNFVDSKYTEKKEIVRSKINETPLIPTYQELYRLGQDCELYEWDHNEIRYHHVSSIVLDHRRSVRRLMYWFNENPNWYVTHYPIAKEFMEKKFAADEAARRKAEVASAKREAAFNKLKNVITPISCTVFKILIPIALCGLAIGLIGGIIALVSKVSLLTWLLTLCILCGITAVSMLGYLICDFIRIYCESRQVRSEPPMIAKIFKRIVGVFCHVIEFVVDTVSMTYKQECPLILWGDETGPIEKRNK